MSQENSEKTPLEERINEVLDLLDAAICKTNRVPKRSDVKDWEEAAEVKQPGLNKATEFRRLNNAD